MPELQKPEDPGGAGDQLWQSILKVARPRRLLRVIVALPFVVSVVVAALNGTDPRALQWTGLSESENVALLLVLLAAGLWITEAISLYVTSFVILFLELAWLAPVMDAGGQKVDPSIFLAPFFSNVVLLFLGGFVLSTAFKRYLLDRLLARWVLSKTGGRPAMVVGGVLCVTAFLSMWMSNTATAAMMLGLSLSMVDRAPPTDPVRRALPLAVAIGSNLGGMGTPIGTPPNAIVVEALAKSGHVISFATWMMMTLPLLVLILASSWWLLLRLYPSQTNELEFDTSSVISLEMKSWTVLAVTGVVGLLWLFSGFHPLATGTVALIPVIVFFGTRMLDRQDFQNLPWDVLFLAGGGLSLGAAVQVSGLGNALVAAIPVGRLGTWGLYAAVALVAATMTTFMSNTATANLLVPVVAGLSVVDTTPLLVLVAYACSATMILPVSTPPNAMVFSSGTISTRDLVRVGLIVSGFSLLLTLLLGPTWWQFLGV